MQRILSPALVALALAATAPATAGDWSGAYVGGYGGLAYGSDLMAGAYAGYSFQSGSVVYGAELDGFYTELAEWEVFAKGRAGYAISDQVLLHGTAGVGTYLGTTALWSLGLGGEAKVTDSLSLRGDYELHNSFGSGLGSAEHFIKAGAVWGF